MWRTLRSYFVGHRTRGAFFEAGLSLGISNEKSNIIHLWVAIGSHKWAEAMGIGAAYVKRMKSSRKKGCILVVIFTLITPVGVGVGLAIDGASKFVTSILTSIAVGLFIYVAVEIST